MHHALVKTLKYILWGLGGLVVLFVVLSGLLLWRLATGPMSVNWLTPYLEEALSTPSSGRRIDVQDTVLVWQMDTQRLELQARQVKIFDHETPLATLPIVDVTLSLAALMHGRLALKTLNLAAARVTLVRSETGAFRFGTAPPEPDAPAHPLPPSTEVPLDPDNQSQVLADIVASLVPGTDPTNPLASLDEVRIDRGTLTVHDQRLGTTWHAMQATLSLRRSTDGLTGKARLSLALQDTLANIDVNVAYHHTAARIAVDVTFMQLQPSALAAVVPNVDAIVGVQVPLSGTISLALDVEGHVDTVHFQVTGEAGHIALPETFAQPLQVASFTARGRRQGEPNIIDLDEATLTLGSEKQPGPRLRLQGSAGSQAGHFSVQGQVSLAALPIADVGRYWPVGLGSPAPAWLVENASMGVVDELHGNIVLTLPREKTTAVQVESFDGKLTGHLPLPNTSARLTAEAAFNRAQQTIALNIAFTDLYPSAVAKRVPGLRELTGIDMPLDGRVTSRLDSAGKVQALQVDITGKAGTVSHPTLFPEARPVSHLTVRGHVSEAEKSFALQEATVKFGTQATPGPIMQASGTMQEAGKHRTIKAQVVLQALPITQLKSYWPVGASDDARTWLTQNLAVGAVEEARANLLVNLPEGDMRAAQLADLTGTIRYRDLEVHYLRPLPPATGVSGVASFNQQGFRIQLNTGQVSAMQFTSGTVDITGLDQRRDAMAIRVGVRTPLHTALALLEHPQLNLLADLQLPLATTSGQATVQLGFTFPLRGVIDLPKVNITAHGTLEKVSIPQVLLGHDVDNGNFTLTLDKAGMQLTGSANFATVPLTIEWQEAFTGEAAWKTQIRAVAPQLTEAHLEKFGVALHDYVSGPLAATVSAKLGQHGKGEIHTVTDLRQAALSIPFLGWQKAAAEPGEMQGTLQLNTATGNQGTFTLAAGTMATHGTFQLARNDAEPLRLQLRDLTLGKTRLKEVSIEHQRQKIAVVVGTGEFDAQPLLRSFAPQQPPPPQPETSHQAPGMAPPAEKTGLRIQVRAPTLQRVYFADNRYLEHVTATLIRAPAGWEVCDITAQVPDALVQLSRAEKRDAQQEQTISARTVTVQYRPGEQQTYTLAVQASDLGSTLRALNLHDGMGGGRLQIDGNALQSQAGTSMQGRLQVKEFTVQQAPVLARILAAASLPGLLKLMHNDGLAFTQLAGDFTLDDGVITTKQLRLHGGALGLTAKGTINVNASTIDLKGTIIPFYGLNTLLSRVPMLGTLLSGGKGEGLIAMTYYLTGKLADPDVAVNPASVLTPGFLRSIFNVFESNNDVESELQLPPPSGEAR